MKKSAPSPGRGRRLFRIWLQGGRWNRKEGSHRGARSATTGVTAKRCAHPLTPTKFKNEKIGSLTRQGEAIFLFLKARREMEPNKRFTESQDAILDARTQRVRPKGGGQDVRRQILSPRPTLPFPDQSFTAHPGRPLFFAGAPLREFCGSSCLTPSAATRGTVGGRFSQSTLAASSSRINFGDE